MINADFLNVGRVDATMAFLIRARSGKLPIRLCARSQMRALFLALRTTKKYCRDSCRANDFSRRELRERTRLYRFSKLPEAFRREKLREIAKKQMAKKSRARQVRC
jgi:hypothetical protein